MLPAIWGTDKGLVSGYANESVSEGDLCRVIASIAQRLDGESALLDLFPELIECGFRPLQLRVGFDSSLPAPAAALGFLLMSATQIGCQMREIVFRAVREELQLDPWLLEAEARFAATSFALAYFHRSAPAVHADPNSYALHPLDAFPPPARFKHACDANATWDKCYRHRRWLTPWYSAASKRQTGNHSHHYTKATQMADAQAGLAFMRAARRNQNVLCQWGRAWNRQDFDAATQLALSVCRETDPWDHQSIHAAVASATGTTRDRDHIAQLAWGFISEPILLTSEPLLRDGTHRIALATAVGATHILALTSPAI